MSITLKNITAADTISSMVDKINFNFDQLLINGGGIEGPRGVEGYPGMQGIRGIKGNTGEQGIKGERGIHFHILPLGSSVVYPSVEYARIYGLDQYDPYGDEYLADDMIIAYRSESNNSKEYNYTDSIWKIEYDDVIRKFKPVYAIKDSNIEKNLLFSMTTFFEDFIIENSQNRLLRTSFVNDASNNSSNAKRGIVLNDYDHHINISGTQLDDIVENNVVLIYTEQVGQSQTSGSPNCGIVFYKNGNTSSEIGNFPRINYIYSDANDNSIIDYFNISAPEQGLHFNSKNDILIKSELGNITLDIADTDKIFELKRNGSTFISLRNQNSHNELHFAGDEIFIENAENTTDQWLKIRNKNYSDTTSCEIILCKQNTFIQNNEPSIFSIGKVGYEFKPSISDNPTESEISSVDDYFNQTRITLINTTDSAHLDIITPKLYIGRDPVDELPTNYGMYLSKEKTSILTTKIDNNDKFYKSNITLNTETSYKSTIILNTTYPGVVNIANVSEVYSSSIINYPHSSIETHNLYGNVKFCTTPMSDGLQKNGRYNYANMNCYYNTAIRNVKNMGAVHGGTIIFNGKYGDSSTAHDKLTYNFIRIGSTVHCTVSGTINLNKVCYRINSSADILIKQLNNIGENYCKSNVMVRSDWPANTSSAQKYPATNSYGVMYEFGKNSWKERGTEDYIAASLVKVSLNKLNLNLYPPVIRIEYDPNTDNGRYIANVKDFTGHLTYTSGGNTYEKELEYYNDLLIKTTVNGNNIYKIRSITVRDMENSSSNDTNSSYNWSGIDDGNSGFVLNGTTSTNIIEINAEFSYRLATEWDDIFQNSNIPISVGTTPVRSSNNSSSTTVNNTDTSFYESINDNLPDF